MSKAKYQERTHEDENKSTIGKMSVNEATNDEGRSKSFSASSLSNNDSGDET